MIRALIFDCYGVLVVDSAAGVYHDDAILAYIVQLRSKYKIALLSNISQAGLARHFSDDQLSLLFDVVVTSGQSGLAKPDPAIFLLATTRLGVEPAEAVMIDDLDTHCDGARQAGLQAVRYQSLPQLQAALAHLANT